MKLKLLIRNKLRYIKFFLYFYFIFLIFHYLLSLKDYDILKNNFLNHTILYIQQKIYIINNKIFYDIIHPRKKTYSDFIYQTVLHILKNKNTSNLKNKISSKKYITHKKIKNKKKIIHEKNFFKKWIWPTHGKIIKHFSFFPGGNKGIDIIGHLGQDVVSIDSGYVVYKGNNLHGYGNLIIIKHRNHYLSAYGHNDKIFVHKKQKVQAGQKIAIMGKTDAQYAKLHFAIAYKGKFVNPLDYFPVVKQ